MTTATEGVRSDMEITITTDRNPEAWGAECDEMLADKAAWILAQKLADDAEEEWPEADVLFGTEHVVSGGSGNLVQVTGTRDFTLANDISQRIGDWAEDQWEAALEIAIESSIA
jgi:hypothetical protein